MPLLSPRIALVGTFRRLLPWEHAKYADHLNRLSVADRRTRFLGVVSDDFIKTHASTALASRSSRIIGWFLDGQLRGAAEIYWNDDGSSEAAFSVEGLYRSCGIGTGLAQRAIRSARNLGLRSMTILTSADNSAMRKLGQKLGASFQINGCDVEGEFAVSKADLLSIVFETAEEERAIVLAAQRSFLDTLSGGLYTKTTQFWAGLPVFGQGTGG